MSTCLSIEKPSGCTSHPGSQYLFTLTPEQMIELTRENPYGRFPDGRPRVPDDVLKKLGNLSAEDVWEVLHPAGYYNQFDGNWMILHPERKLIGRAVTAQFMPLRPDVDQVLDQKAKQGGVKRPANQRIIDVLEDGDVIVVDLFGKREGGTFVGDLLAAAIYAATKTGMVVDGAIRDLEGIYPFAMSSYVRSAHPTPLHQVMLTGINVPVRIGSSTVMPGDVVFGDREGVYFIPPELSGKIVEHAGKASVYSEWVKAKLATGLYKSCDLYPAPRNSELLKEYEEFKEKGTKARSGCKESHSICHSNHHPQEFGENQR